MLKLKIPPPAYMLIFAALMWGLNQYFPLAQLIAPAWHKLGLFIIAIAVLLDFTALLLFIKRKTTPNPFAPDKASQLITSGMYAYSRNPMYVGLALLLTGWAIYLGSLSPFVLIPLFILTLNVQQIIPEEKILEAKFGSDYLQYKQSVRRWV